MGKPLFSLRKLLKLLIFASEIEDGREMARVDLKSLQVTLHGRFILVFSIQDNTFMIPKVTVHINKVIFWFSRFYCHCKVVLAIDEVST
jgi:hypothetical protein